MNRPVVYGLGYSGRDLDDIVRIAQRLDAIVADIRFSPYSRNPQFRQPALQARLGADYVHMRSFGNRNYKGGPIEIVNYADGKAWVLQQTRDVILMCMCKDPATCHRTTVMQRLAEDGFTTHEINAHTPDLPRQLLLL